MEEKFIKLTNAVYKVLEFFPESDPLKHRAKDRALAIMERLTLVNENSGWASFQKEKVKVQVLEDIDVLLGYLWIGKSQGWLNSASCLIIANEYEKIKKYVEPITTELTQKLPGLGGLSVPKESAPQSIAPVLNNAAEKNQGSFVLSERQRKIIEFLTNNEKAQVMDLQTILPDITKRTIRRDLDELLENGKIVRLGDFNQIFYKIS